MTTTDLESEISAIVASRLYEIIVTAVKRLQGPNNCLCVECTEVRQNLIWYGHTFFICGYDP